MRRVVVTGVGLVIPLGIGADEAFAARLRGEDGHRPTTLFPTDGFATDLSAGFAEVPRPDVDDAHLRRMLRVDRFAMVAAGEALESSGALDAKPAGPVGVCVGAGAAGLYEATRFFDEREHSGRAALRGYFGELQSSVGRWIAWRYGLTGPRACPSTACSSSLTAIGIGTDWIRRGEVDVALVGGSETLSPLTFSGFNAVSALSPSSCRPFSAERNGMSLGEGGAVLMLEEASRAAGRGIAEVLAFATSGDAYHMTAPHPAGEGAATVIRSCLAQAGLAPEEIDHIDAHGTGTLANDASECTALRSVFGDRVFGDRPLTVVSQKGAVGHTLGAAGAVESALALLSIREQALPPNLKLDTVDPELGPLDFPTRARHDVPIRYVVKESFGFGGSNSAVIFGARGGE